jgi:hypothetical protein
MSGMPNATGAATRHLLLPQEAGGRRLIARMVARQTGPNRQRADSERYLGPDGIVYFEAVVGDVIVAGLGIFGGAALAAIAGRGVPETVGLWMMSAGGLSAAFGTVRALQAMRAGKAFRGGGPVIGRDHSPR